jgi:tRNA(Ile)-lysidine synthase
MLLQRVRQFVRRHALCGAETRVVVALSGGSDSVALALLLSELNAAGELRLVGAAHLNHQAREHAGRDERFSASVAQLLGLPFTADRDDVPARARRERRSFEAAARRARHDFFERARGLFDADVVALGHTRDDQAETVLLRLLRGAGPRGLSGMHPRSGIVIRPLLDSRRRELRAYLEARGVGYVEDETNGDVAIPRNRVRAELLPLLERRFNPAIVDVLAREAELAREIWTWLETSAAGHDPESGAAGLDVAGLQAAPAPLRRLVLWRAMTAAAGGRPVTFEHVEAVLRLLDSSRGGLDAPGHRVERAGSRIVLVPSGETPGRRAAPVVLRADREYSLRVPGQVELADSGCVVAAELSVSADEVAAHARSGKGTAALVRWDPPGGALIVRYRRPGDRFRPVGMIGYKKLQDYFVDRKVARARRDRIPLVLDETGRIVWVAGYGIDEAFRVTDPSQSMLLLRLR